MVPGREMKELLASSSKQKGCKSSQGVEDEKVGDLLAADMHARAFLE